MRFSLEKKYAGDHVWGRCRGERIVPQKIRLGAWLLAAVFVNTLPTGELKLIIMRICLYPDKMAWYPLY